MPASDDLVRELRNLFIRRFSYEELKNLAFVLDPRAGNLGETTLDGMARELALFIVRRDWVDKLVNEVGPRERSDFDWKKELPSFTSVGLLSDNDRRKLIEVLGDRNDMRLGPAVRISLLQNAGVGNRVSYIDLVGAPIKVAERIVVDLEPLGILPGRPGYHALGALINHIRLQPDINQDDGRALAELIVKYQLINDRDYLDRLTASFNLNVTTVRQVDPTLRPPSIKDNESLAKLALKDDREIEMPTGRSVGTGFLTDDDRRKLIRAFPKSGLNESQGEFGVEGALGKGQVGEA